METGDRVKIIDSYGFSNYAGVEGIIDKIHNGVEPLAVVLVDEKYHNRKLRHAPRYGNKVFAHMYLKNLKLAIVLDIR